MLISGTPDSRFQSDLEHVKKACRHVWVILLPTVTCLKELELHGKGFKGRVSWSAHVCIIYSPSQAFWQKCSFSLFMNQSQQVT